MPRPRKQIDEERVLALASNFCTAEEIAADQKCSPKTINRRFDQVLKRGRELAKMSLRARQFQVAIGRPGEPAEYLRQGNGDIFIGKDGKPVKIKAEVKPIAPSPIMLKWLGVNELGQSERFVVEDGDGFEFKE